MIRPETFWSWRTKTKAVHSLIFSGKISEIRSKSEIFNFRYIDFKTLLSAKNCSQRVLRTQMSNLNAYITPNHASWRPKF